MDIPKSPAKVVFIMIAATACIAFLIEIAKGVVTFDTKDFMILAGSAFAFFFAYKGSDNQPFAGK